MYYKETMWEVWAGFIWLRIREISGLFVKNNKNCYIKRLFRTKVSVQV